MHIVFLKLSAEGIVASRGKEYIIEIVQIIAGLV